MNLTQPITCLGEELDTAKDCFGWLQPSTNLLGDAAALKQRLDEDGYLYLPGYLDRAYVDEARNFLLHQISAMGLLNENAPVENGIARQPWQPTPCHHLVNDNLPLQQLLYDGPMIELYQRLLGNEISHFDFTGMRVMGPGHGTAPHADAVYMNRGSQQLFTSWTPLMEIDLDMGGLLVMPGSHKVDRLEKYFESDVDTYCTNKPNREPQDVHRWIGPVGDGKLTAHPAKLQKSLGLPWLTAERYQPGDVLIFGIRTVHASIDNTTNRIRLSTDSRYQRSNEELDERWIGPDPIGHGENARKGLIC